MVDKKTMNTQKTEDWEIIEKDNWQVTCIHNTEKIYAIDRHQYFY